MEEMQKRLAATERVLQLRKEQDQQLRDSIVLARQQVGSWILSSILGMLTIPLVIGPACNGHITHGT